MVEQCIAPYKIQEGDLVAYMEGDASPDVVRHITHCPACAAEVEALRQVDAMFNTVLNRASMFSVPEVSAPRTDTQPAQPERQQTPIKAGRASRFHQKWLAWPRISFQGAWQIALVFVSLFVLLGFVVAVYNANVHNAIEAFISADAVVENPSAIAPPRRLLIMLEDELPGLVEDPSAIAPPRSLLAMLEEELQTQIDQSTLVYSPVKSEAYWDKSLVVDPTSDNTYFIWIDNVDGYSTIYAARSTDDGQTLSNAVPISQGIDRAFNPVLAMDSQGSLYVIWRTRHHLEINIYFARSTDGGQTWSNSVRINNEVKQAFNPSLAVDTQGHLYVAWENQPVVGTDIYLAYSADGGQTWSKERRMAN